MKGWALKRGDCVPVSRSSRTSWTASSCFRRRRIIPIDGRVAPTEVKDLPCPELGIALDFKVNGEEVKRLCDKNSLGLTEIIEPELPLRAIVAMPRCSTPLTVRYEWLVRTELE